MRLVSYKLFAVLHISLIAERQDRPNNLLFWLLVRGLFNDVDSSQIISCGIVRRLVNSELEKIWMEEEKPNFRYYHGIRLEEHRNRTMILNQDILSPDRDLNTGPPDYEAGVLPSRQRRSVISEFCDNALRHISLGVDQS
jgi:hypothetical protein